MEGSVEEERTGEGCKGRHDDVQDSTVKAAGSRRSWEHQEYLAYCTVVRKAGSQRLMF